MDIFFDNEFRNLIPPLQPDERERLETSLKGPEGNRVPITIWKEKQLLLDGHNRYDICTANNIPLKAAEELSFPDREAAMIWIIDNQLGRRNIAEYVRIRLSESRVEKVAIRNATVQKSTLPRKGQKGFQEVNVSSIVELTLDNPKSSNDTMTEVAKVAKTTRSKVYKTRVIEARATPEQKEQLVNGSKTINQVFVAVRRDEIKEQVKTAVIPTGMYRVIYADPPWRYGNTQPDYHEVQDDHYPTMTVKEICDLEIGDRKIAEIALDNAVLFLWVCNQTDKALVNCLTCSFYDDGHCSSKFGKELRIYSQRKSTI